MNCPNCGIGAENITYVVPVEELHTMEEVDGILVCDFTETNFDVKGDLVDYFFCNQCFDEWPVGDLEVIRRS